MPPCLERELCIDGNAATVLLEGVLPVGAGAGVGIALVKQVAHRQADLHTLGQPVGAQAQVRHRLGWHQTADQDCQ